MTHLSHVISKLAHRFAHTLAIIFCILSLALVLILATAHIVLARVAGQLGPVIRREMERSLGRSVRVGAVRLDGIRTLTVSDIALAQRGSFANGTAVAIPRALARVNLLSLLVNPGQNPLSAVDRIELREPAIAVSRDAGGRFDFQDVLERLRRHQTTGALQARVVVSDADVRYRDTRGFGDTPRLFDQRFTAVHAIFMPHGDGGVAFTARGTDDAHRVRAIALVGTYAPKAGRAQVKVSAQGIDVRALAKLLPHKLPITFEDGTAALRLSALLTNLPTPAAVHASPASAFTAEVDLRGVGLRLDELTTPIVATSGRLRLVHDTRRYPQGSRLEFINVRAMARDIPVRLSGRISDINLLDLAHLRPLFDLRVKLANANGAAISRLFPTNEWAHTLVLNGPVTLDSRISGHPADLRIDGALHSRRFAVRGLHAEDVRAAFTLTPAGTTTVRATATVGRLASATADLDALKLQLRSSTPWRKLEKTPVLTGAASADRVRLPWTTLTSVQGQLVATDDGVSVRQMHAGLFGGQAVAGVTFPFALHDGIARADATVSGIDLAQFATAIHLPVLAGHAGGTLQLVVLPGGGVTVTADVSSTDAAFRGYRALQADASLRVENGADGLHIVVQRASATTDFGTFIATDGLLVKPESGPSRITMALRGTHIPLARFGDPEEYAGEVTLDGLVSGDLNSPTLSASATASDSKLAGYHFATGRASITYQSGGALRFRDVALARQDMDVTLAGGADGFDPREGLTGQDATLNLHGASLADVLALFKQDCPIRVDGGIEGMVRLHVGDNGVTATGDAAIANATVHVPQDDGAYPLGLRRIALAFDYADRTLTVRGLRLERGSTAIIASGTAASPLGSDLAVDLAYHTDGAEMGDVPHELIGLPVALTGPVDAHGTLNGALDGKGATPLVLTVSATSPNADAAGVPLGAGDAALAYSYRPDDKQLAFDHVTFANAAFTARGSGRYNATRGTLAEVALDVTLMRLSRLAALLQSADSGLSFNLPDGLDGTLALRLRADGAANLPTLRLNTDITDATYAGKPLPNLRVALTGARVNDEYLVRLADAALTTRDGVVLAQASGLLLGGEAPDVTLTSDIGGLTARATLRGTWARPVITATATGAVTLPNSANMPNRIDNLDVRLRVDGDRSGVTLHVDRLAATLVRTAHGTPVKGFTPGWFAGDGDVRIPGTAWQDPRRWQWDLYAAADMPVDATMFLVPQAAGYLHLGTDAGGPVLNGALLVSGTQISKPKLTAGAVPQWGPYRFNPRLDVLVQVGNFVKLRNGMFRIPLRATPLDVPAIPAAPLTALDHSLSVFTASARQARPETTGEMTGTWGAITGTVNEPAIYARFEVEKARLSFPLSLVGAIRHARGHVTYSRVAGPQLVMGIPDFPVQTAKQ